MEAIQTRLRGFIRVLIFFGYVPFFLASSYFLHLVTRDEDTRKRRFSAHGRWWCALCCRTFGISVRTKNKPPDDANGLVVGNHLGFIDILAVASIQPNLFVTSREMRETPLLGLFTEFGGCIYVERRSRANILNELGEMVSWLKKGYRVTIYPEATSHNGEEVLPFKRTLLTAAAQAGVPVRPYVFNFVEINGEPGFKRKYRDSVCWYGDIGFAQSLWSSLCLKSLVCEVEYLDPVWTKVEDDRAQVADRLRDKIVAKFKPVHD